MPELRHDPIQKRWIIVASERGHRPSDFMQPSQQHADAGYCPFCAGHESATPTEISSMRESGTPDTPGWTVRVVPNRFPALKIEGNLDRRAVGQYDRINGIGAHEVIVETPDHDQMFADLPVDHMSRVLRTYRNRLADLRQDSRFKYILIFKNHGAAGGASLAHSHSQLIATPVTPRTVAIELNSAREHFSLKERCIFCDIITQEIESRSRIVVIDPYFVTFCPYASRFPFEMMVVPRAHCHEYSLSSDELLQHLAHHFREVLARMNKALNNPPYNFLLHTSPNVSPGTPLRRNYWQTLSADFHWHFEILPRLSNVAGFEWGTGFYINPTPPEDAAAYLREVRL